MEHIKIIAKEMQWGQKYIENIITLLDEGNTIPFIARYRKEATNSMDETKLREIEARLSYLRNLDKRKEEVLRIIDEQGKLTKELAEQIQTAQKLQLVEDLYLPYRQKRRTRATLAKEKGLETLAKAILEDASASLNQLAEAYLDPEKELHTVEEVLKGAADIICEYIQEDAPIRGQLRDLYRKQAVVSVKNLTKEESVYDRYYDFEEPVSKILPHRVMAINRGEKEGFLQVKVAIEEEKISRIIQQSFFSDKAKKGREAFYEAVTHDTIKRLLHPSVEREIRNELTEAAQIKGIKVFADNVESLLLQSPVKKQAILGIDPSYRTGCKLAVINESGQVLDIGVIYPHQPQNKVAEAKKKLLELIGKWEVDLIVIGNGTASRETESLVAALIQEHQPDLSFVIVSEAGASVYSASVLAKEEFPNLDVSERSAISIARRVLDPLAELVKIEPRSIGVGQYQHDIAGKTLDESLKNVVESSVNRIGVEINTASASLLQYVAGLNKTMANNIIQYRDQHKGIQSRKELLKVPRLGEKAFVQAAGFIRIRNGKNPLENTSVHPESYAVAEKILAMNGFSPEDLRNKETQESIYEALRKIDARILSKELDYGVETIMDIINDLMKPGRDPREDLPKPLMRNDIVKLEDLHPGMVLEGTVTNVVDFGAFIDIGLKNDGLCHISELSGRFIRHPMEVVSVGNIVKTKILDVDKKKGRVSLSLKNIEGKGEKN